MSRSHCLLVLAGAAVLATSLIAASYPLAIACPSNQTRPSNFSRATDVYGHWERAERKIQAAKMEDAFPV